MLPGAEIKFDNGNIGAVVPSPDGLLGYIASAVAVGTTFELNKPYVVAGMQDVATLGIVPDLDNHKLYTGLKEFFEEAGQGTQLYLMGMPKTDKVSDWFTPDGTTGKTPAEKLLDAGNGKINGLFTSYDPLGAFEPTIVDGLDDDVPLAKQQAQLLAVNYTNNYFAPFFVLLEGYAFNGEHVELVNLNEESNNRVAVIIGSTESRTALANGDGAANHVIAARLAKSQVHVNPGKVKDGPLATLTAFIVDTPIELYNVEALHNKGYITFRTHVRKAGYYITDDPLATAISDDYHYISKRRVIDKAFRIAYEQVIEEVNNDLDLLNDGTVSPHYAKAIEAKVEGAIAVQMTANGELSADPSDNNDLGVQATFDTTVNVAQTSQLKMSLKVRPKGTVRWFEVLLGFSVNLEN